MTDAKMVELADGSLAFYPPRPAGLGILACHVKVDGRPCKWAAQMDTAEQGAELLWVHLADKHPGEQMPGGRP